MKSPKSIKSIIKEILNTKPSFKWSVVKKESNIPPINTVIMTLKNVVKEQTDNLDWIRDSKPTLRNKVLYFEPMLDPQEYEVLRQRIINFCNEFGEDLVWKSGNDFNDRNPFHSYDLIFLHHLLIDINGVIVYGGMDRYDYNREFEYISDSPENIEKVKTYFEPYRDNVVEYIEEDNNKSFHNPEWVNGREYFNI